MKQPKTENEKLELFETYSYIAEKLSRHFAKKYHRQITETRDHAQFALCLMIYDESRWTYDGSKGTLDTWLGTNVYWHLQEIYCRGKHPACPELREPFGYNELHDTDLINQWDEGVLPAPESIAIDTPWITDLLERTTSEGRAVIEIILNAPAELLDDILPQQGRTAKQKQNNVWQYLIDVLDWHPATATSAMNDIQAALQNI